MSFVPTSTHIHCMLQALLPLLHSNVYFVTAHSSTVDISQTDFVVMYVSDFTTVILSFENRGKTTINMKEFYVRCKIYIWSLLYPLQIFEMLSLKEW